jgi:large subunit ribosomal protein L22
MVSRAILRYARLSPRKVRQVIDLIRGKETRFAEAILLNTNKRPAHHVLKVLRSAVANAEHNAGLKGIPLVISKITADGGPAWKRYRSAPFGRANTIKRRTSHITIELDRKEDKVAVKKETKDKNEPSLPKQKRISGGKKEKASSIKNKQEK